MQDFNLIMKKMKNILSKKLAFSILLGSSIIIGCSDLEIEQTDSIIDSETAESGVFNGVGDVEGALDNIYNGFNRIGDQANIYAIQEVSTDELLVPTRGTDWGDNGIWRVLHQHTWDPTHQYILAAWNNWNSSIFNTTEVIDDRSSPTTEQKAQASFARAYAMFLIMDSFGQVPFRAPDEGPDVNPRVLSRAEAYEFILNDLDVAIAGLSPVAAMDMDNLNRGSKASARFLKAKLLLNAHIYNGSGTPAASDMNEVISLVEDIEAEGFALQEGYFEIFSPEPDTETIWWLPTAVGNRIWNGMHYNQNSPDNTGGGWNGFATLAEFYDLFEGDPNTNAPGSGQEERRGFVPANTNDGPLTPNFGIGYGFLIGQQYDEDGTALKTRNGQPLIFTKEYPGLVGNGDATGIRTIKYHPVNGSFTAHELIFRFSDAHLMKIEAIFNGGTSADDALTLMNDLRLIRDAQPLTSLTEQDIIDERGRELYKEMWRRNDLIRFGQFTKNWEFKNPESVGDETKNLFPIPTNAILSNPNLTQNPGY